MVPAYLRQGISRIGPDCSNFSLLSPAIIQRHFGAEEYSKCTASSSVDGAMQSVQKECGDDLGKHTLIAKNADSDQNLKLANQGQRHLGERLDPDTASRIGLSCCFSLNRSPSMMPQCVDVTNFVTLSLCRILHEAVYSSLSN